MNRTAIIAGLIPLLAAGACSDLPTDLRTPGEARHHHQPGHPGGPGGGGGGEAPANYEVRVIDADGTFAGNSLALGIDEHGTVAGRARVSFENYVPRAFRWAEGFDDLQVLSTANPAADSDALAIHDGIIAGWEGTNHNRTAFLYEVESESVQYLGHLDREACIDDYPYSSSPVTVAEWGVAGTSACTILSPAGDPVRSERPVVWLAGDDHRPHELPLQEGDRSVRIRDVNDNRVVLGHLWRDGSPIVVIWNVSGSGEISGPHQRPSGSLHAAFEINNAGDIVGPVGARAELVTENGAAVSLERLHNRDGSISAFGLTDRVDGVVRVVGHSGDRPALWTVDVPAGEVLSAVYLDVPEGNYREAHAVAINAEGAIAGYSITRARRGESARQRATVWLPQGSHP